MPKFRKMARRFLPFDEVDFQIYEYRRCIVKKSAMEALLHIFSSAYVTYMVTWAVHYKWKWRAMFGWRRKRNVFFTSHESNRSWQPTNGNKCNYRKHFAGQVFTRLRFNVLRIIQGKAIVDQWWLTCSCQVQYHVLCIHFCLWMSSH